MPQQRCGASLSVCARNARRFRSDVPVVAGDVSRSIDELARVVVGVVWPVGDTRRRWGAPGQPVNVPTDPGNVLGQKTPLRGIGNGAVEPAHGGGQITNGSVSLLQVQAGSTAATPMRSIPASW